MPSGPDDDTAGDAGRSVGAGATSNSVYHDGGAAIAEHGMVIVAECDVWSYDRHVGGAGGVNYQRKIRDVAGWGRLVIVLSSARIEVWAGGFEVRRIALCDLMYVNGMLARRQVLDIERDLHTFWRAGEQRGSNALSLGILELDSDRFGGDTAFRFLRRGRCSENEEQTHPT